jgi:peroxisomal membrane protein 2
LCFFQEVLGSNIARLPAKRPSKDDPSILQLLARAHIDLKAVKMAMYGFLISAPLSHFLFAALQKTFKGKTGTLAKIAQIFTSNLLIAPIQTAGEFFPPIGSESVIRIFYVYESISFLNGRR